MKMKKYENSLLIEQYEIGTQESFPIDHSTNDELADLFEVLNDNSVTTDKQTSRENVTIGDFFYPNSSGNKVRISKKIDILFNYFAQSYKSVETDTFYKYLQQYDGIVDSIDFDSEKFTAILTSIDDETQKFFAEFDFGDLQYPSDLALINIGANFIWLVGKETRKSGQQTNMSKFVFRRKKILCPRKIEEAKRDANEWTEFFKSIDVSNSTK